MLLHVLRLVFKLRNFQKLYIMVGESTKLVILLHWLHLGTKDLHRVAISTTVSVRHPHKSPRRAIWPAWPDDPTLQSVKLKALLTP